MKNVFALKSVVLIVALVGAGAIGAAQAAGLFAAPETSQAYVETDERCFLAPEHVSNPGSSVTFLVLVPRCG